MIRITRDISIDEGEIVEQFIRSSGPGGQHVNKTSTAVQLRFNVPGSSLPEDVKSRLTRLAGNRMADSGDLIIEARSHRSQDRNRKEAAERLIALIREAARPPKPRKKTRPSKAAKRRRLEKKRERSEKKQRRKPVSRRRIEE